jgi:hypothetical protein
MIINKITVGFVIQKFDTETGKCVSQSFVAGDDVQYETEEGEPVNLVQHSKKISQSYFPFDMVQP